MLGFRRDKTCAKIYVEGGLKEDYFMKNLKSLYPGSKRKTAENMAIFFQHKKVSKEILFLVFLGCETSFSPRGS